MKRLCNHNAFSSIPIRKKTYIKTANIAYMQSLVVIMLFNTLLPEYGILSEIPLVVSCYIYGDTETHLRVNFFENFGTLYVTKRSVENKSIETSVE